MKLAVIGLDGACMDLIETWSEEGKLKTFSELLEDGCHSRLESVIPTVTIPAWNCMTTGKNPGKIGCFSFIQKEYRTYNFKMYSSLVEKELDVWDILNMYGKKIFLFNLANVQYAYRINGYMVAGFLCMRDEFFTYPRELRERLDALGFEKDITDLRVLGAMGDKEHSNRHVEITESQTRTIRSLLKDDAWDFVFVVLNELDRIQHRFWHKKKVLLRHYKNVDKNVGKILNALEDDYNVLIVSDHGFGPNRRVFHINEWFRRNGLLDVELEESMVRRVLATLKKPYFAKPLRPLLSTSFLRRIYQKALVKTGKVPVVWERSKAFSYGSFGQVYINLKGREPKGVVDPKDYERLRDEIIRELGKINVKAYRAEELYSGKYMYMAPDIVVQTDEFVTTISGRVGVDVFVDGFGGAHDRLNGTFIAWGPDVKRKVELNAHIYDVTPTILHAFGVPIPKDVDGKILDVFELDRRPKFVDYDGLRSKLRRLRRRV